MELKEILTLIDAVSESKLGSFSLEQDGVCLNLTTQHLKGNVIPLGVARGYDERYKPVYTQEVHQQLEKEMGQEPENIQQKETDNIKDLEVNKQKGNVVKSPLVGTFYNAQSPDAPAYVQVGDTVKKGQVLGIIEAMKLMNEIESEYDGVVTEILVDNESMVEFGQPLFIIS